MWFPLTSSFRPFRTTPDRRSVSVNQDPRSTFSSAARGGGGGGRSRGRGGDLANGSSAAASVAASDSFVGRVEGAFYLLALLNTGLPYMTTTQRHGI